MVSLRNIVSFERVKWTIALYLLLQLSLVSGKPLPNMLAIMP